MRLSLIGALMALGIVQVFGCATDLDCHLNGVCSTGTCACFKPWTGAGCGELDVLPIPNTAEGYGMSPNLTSWGGQIVLHDGLYHLFVAEMKNHCLLEHWSYNSECMHAVSKSPLGPFQASDVSVPVFCHNPQITTFAKPDGTTGFALFHIGTGTGASLPPFNCENGSAPHLPRAMRELQREASVGARLHIADSPYGPWTPVTTVPPCNNPTPFVHPNGTVFLVCGGNVLYRAPSVTGPYTQVASTGATGGVDGIYEDPFLFIDPRGNWHIIYHTYNSTEPCGICPGWMVSGHRFSPDGFTWHASDVMPYTQNIERQNGSVWTVSTRERPKLFLNEAGDPEYLLTGTCGAVETCPPTEAVNCKYTFWDFTLVQGLAV